MIDPVLASLTNRVATRIEGETHRIADRGEVRGNASRRYLLNFVGADVGNKQIASGIKGKCIGEKPADKYRSCARRRKLVDFVTGQLTAV